MVDSADIPEHSKVIFFGDRGYTSYNNFAHVIEKGHDGTTGGGQMGGQPGGNTGGNGGIPALDGGKIVLNILEVIRRKPLKQEIETYVTLAGVVIMVVLMIAVTWNDIMRLFFR